VVWAAPSLGFSILAWNFVRHSKTHHPLCLKNLALGEGKGMVRIGAVATE
jgi:hypothetical protein